MQLLTPGLGLIIWTLLAFIVVFFILKKFAWPAILGGLRKREQTIADSLAQADYLSRAKGVKTRTKSSIRLKIVQTSVHD